eukprot:12419564-Karenia_brevis.AAC.1
MNHALTMLCGCVPSNLLAPRKSATCCPNWPVHIQSSPAAVDASTLAGGGGRSSPVCSPAEDEATADPGPTLARLGGGLAKDAKP